MKAKKKTLLPSISLPMQVLIAVIAGVLCGIFLPKVEFFGLIGDLFVESLKGIAPLLVFVLVLTSIAGADTSKGEEMKTILEVYMVAMAASATLAVITGSLLDLQVPLDGLESYQASAPKTILEVFHQLFMDMVENPISALSNSNYLSLLFWGSMIGVSIRRVASPNAQQMIQEISDSIADVVGIVVSFAPLGIFGCIFEALTTASEDDLLLYALLLAVLSGLMLTVMFIINPLIVWVLTRENPYPLVLRCLRSSGITAFFTRSSAANIPVNMAICESMKIDRNLYSVSIPLGANINMEGAAITIAIMTLAATGTLGIIVTPFQAIMLVIMSTLAGLGASGITGGSLLLIPWACTVFGIDSDIALQLVSVGFVLGVVQDSLETMLNSSSDVLFTAAVDKRYRRLHPSDAAEVTNQYEDS